MIVNIVNSIHNQITLILMLLYKTEVSIMQPSFSFGPRAPRCKIDDQTIIIIIMSVACICANNSCKSSNSSSNFDFDIKKT